MSSCPPNERRMIPGFFSWLLKEMSRNNRRGRSKHPPVYLNPDRPIEIDPNRPLEIQSVTISGCVVDLTREPPFSRSPSSQRGNTSRRPATRGRTSSVIVIDEVIDLSTPKKGKRCEKRRLDDSPSKKPKEKMCKSSDAGICPICFEKLDFVDSTPQKQVMSTQCGHMYCRSCITSVLKEKEMCPKCRRKQTIRDIHPLYM